MLKQPVELVTCLSGRRRLWETLHVVVLCKNPAQDLDTPGEQGQVTFVVHLDSKLGAKELPRGSSSSE